MASPRLPRTVPDQAGRTVVVTGANSGIGRETALALTRAGARVVMACRREAKADEAAGAIEAATGTRPATRALDLASLASVRAFAAGLDRVDVLVNNAGLVLDERRETEDGFELMVGVNHLGPYLLTRLLEGRVGRVVNVASVAHHRVTRRLDAAALDGEGGRRFNPFLQYGRSKLANVLFTRELARRWEGRVEVAAVHPGVVRSGFGAEGDHAVIGPLVEAFGRVVMISPERGARTQTALAARPDVTPWHGAYLVRGRVHRPSRLARDADHARWLWDESARRVGLA